jgi:hypothetical protein
MLFTLILATFATPAATPLASLPSALPQPQQQMEAVDYFPADTLAVIEFSLEPWDRLRKQTIAHPILRELRILRTFSDQWELELAESGNDPEYDSRQLLGQSRIYVGVSGSLLSKGSLLIGIDLYDESIRPGVEKLMKGISKEPYRKAGDSYLAIVPIGSKGKLSNEENLELLDELISVATPQTSADGGEAAIPYTLTQQDSWIQMHQELSSKDRMIGVWIASEPWLDGHGSAITDLVAAEVGSSAQADMAMKMVVDMMGLKQFRGLAYSLEVAPPFIQERGVLFGSGPIMDIYHPYSDDADECWDRLENCDGDSISSLVGGVNIGPFARRLFDQVTLMMGQMGYADVQSNPDFDYYVTPMLDFCDAMGPGVVSQISLERLETTAQAETFIAVNDMDKAKDAIRAMAPKILSGMELGLASAGSGFSVDWVKDGFVLMNDPDLDGKSKLKDQPDFKATLPAMKKISGDTAPLFASYISPEYDAYFLSQLEYLAGTIADSTGQELLVDFSKLSDVSKNLQRMHPGFSVWTKQPGKILLQTQSTFGTMPASSIVMLRAFQEQMEAGQLLELDEDEF